MFAASERNNMSAQRFVSYLMGIAFVGLVCLTATGCGDSAAADTLSAGGKVVYTDGSPVKGANVQFVPKGKGYQAVGSTNEAGEFTLTTFNENDGAAEGEYDITITAGGDETASPVPAKYADMGNGLPPAKIAAGSENQFELKIEKQ
jgi:hypothetical protein